MDRKLLFWGPVLIVASQVFSGCGGDSERDAIGFPLTPVKPMPDAQRGFTPTPTSRDRILGYVLSKGEVKGIDALEKDVEKLWKELLAGREGVEFAGTEIRRWSREAFEELPQNLNDSANLANVGFVNRRIFGLGMIAANAARAYCATGDKEVFRTYSDVAATMNAQIAFFAALNYQDKTYLLRYYLVPECMEKAGQELLQ